MENIRIFENAEFGKVRTVDVDGVIHFVGKDVAQALGYKNTKDALAKHVDAEDKGGSKLRHPWRKAGNDNNHRKRTLQPCAFKQASHS